MTAAKNSHVATTQLIHGTDICVFRISTAEIQLSYNLTSLCSASYVTCQRDTARICCRTPLLLGARRPPLSIDISCPHGAQQQTRRTPRLRSNDGTDRQTEYGRTLDRFIDPAPRTVRAVSTNVTVENEFTHLSILISKI